MDGPTCPIDWRGTEVPPDIYVLVTLPPSIETKGFELNKGFQPKWLLKGTVVAMLVEAVEKSKVVDMKGVEARRFKAPLIGGVTKLLG